ncbi:MAG: hypothetical protein U1E23_15000 [Reyranellaceae bacterium]
MRKALLFGLLLGTFASGAAGQTLDGVYAVGGTNFDGSAYSGTAEIRSGKNGCAIVWRTGQTVSQGACIVSGRSMAAVYKLGNEYGLVLYDRATDGSLKGRWTIPGKQGEGSETLVPKKN